MKLSLYYPLPVHYVTQKFGETAFLDYYKKNGIEKQSYLEFHPIVAPFLGKLFDGIINIFFGLLFTKQTQQKKSIGFSLLRLKIQLPDCFCLTGIPLLNFLLYRLHALTSIRVPSLSKSGPLLKVKCLAFKRLATYLSHVKPIPVDVLKNSLSRLKHLEFGWFLKCQDCLIHFLEQNFGLVPLSLLQRRHLFI